MCPLDSRLATTADSPAVRMSPHVLTGALVWAAPDQSGVLGMPAWLSAAAKAAQAPTAQRDTARALVPVRQLVVWILLREELSMLQ